MNKKEEILKLINQNELIRMCKSRFDSETVTQGINELMESILNLFPQEEQKEVTYQDVVDYLKTLPQDTCVSIFVMPHDENNTYNIQVFLYDDKYLGIVGDFGEHYEWNELEIIDINYK